MYALAIPAAAVSSIPPADQDQALAAASDEADSYMRNKYTLPLVSWTQDLRRAVCRIAAYTLLSSRGFNPQENSGDQNIADNNSKAVAWLRDVGKGLASPGLVDSSPSQLPAVPSVSSNRRRRWED